MTLVDQVSEVQENFRDLLHSSSVREDKTLEEEALTDVIKKYGEDSIINMAIAVMSQTAPPDAIASMMHLVKAVGLMDDLDTLGMEVRFKR